MSSNLFTVDEIRHVLKWAHAYLDEHGLAERQNNPDLFAAEIDKLHTKLIAANASALLGFLNCAFLLGFAAAESAHPLNSTVDAAGLDSKQAPTASELEARQLLLSFMNEAGLISEDRL